jgi:transcription initiation factor IIE alpha subunit
MKTQAKDTSIDCYHKLVEGNFEASQNAKVFSIIKMAGKITGHMISDKTGIDTNAVGRCLNSLEKEGLIERPEELKAKCEITNVRVYWWRIKQKVVKIPDPGIQTHLPY